MHGVHSTRAAQMPPMKCMVYENETIDKFNILKSVNGDDG